MRRPLVPVAAALLALASACALGGDSHSLFPDLPQSRSRITTKTGTHDFRVWIAADDASRARGLMHVRELPRDYGMLFLFERPQFVSFWMKDTYLSLDLIFIGRDGVVVNVARQAEPLSLQPIPSAAPVVGVLELAAGTAASIELGAGDLIQSPALSRPPEN